MLPISVLANKLLSVPTIKSTFFVLCCIDAEIIVFKHFFRG